MAQPRRHVVSAGIDAAQCHAGGVSAATIAVRSEMTSGHNRRPRSWPDQRQARQASRGESALAHSAPYLANHVRNRPGWHAPVASLSSTDAASISEA